MIALAASALALALWVPPADQNPAADVALLRQAGRYREAWELSADIPDPVSRQRARLDVLYWGGDLRGALREGRAGLALAPSDAWLLHQCARLSQDLGAIDLLADCAARLESALPSIPEAMMSTFA